MRKGLVLSIFYIVFLISAQATTGTSVKLATAEQSSLILEIASGPVSKDLVVNFSEANPGAVITITDLKGEKLTSVVVEAGATKAIVNVSKLNAGTYFVVLNNGSSRTSKLFIKQ